MQKSSNSTNSTHRNTYLYKGLRTFLFRSFTAIWLILCLNFFSHKARLASNWAADCVFILFERIWTNVTLFVNGRKKAEAKMMLIQMGCFLFSIWFSHAFPKVKTQLDYFWKYSYFEFIIRLLPEKNKSRFSFRMWNLSDLNWSIWIEEPHIIPICIDEIILKTCL